MTAIAGFGVLVLSDIRMLRDFGLVTLIDLSVSLAGVLVALPAALLLFGDPAPRARHAPWRSRGGAGADAAGTQHEPLARPLAMAALAPGSATPARGEERHEGR